jgi:hypothetical protein
LKVRQLFAGIILMLLGLTFLGCLCLSGCPRRCPIRDFSVISDYVDKKVTAEGCPEFVCSKVLGAVYPRDCLVALYDVEHNEVLLEFEAATAHLRDELDRYYPAYPGFVRVVVEGTVMGRRGDDFYYIHVSDLSAYWLTPTPTTKSLTRTPRPPAVETPVTATPFARLSEDNLIVNGDFSAGLEGWSIEQGRKCTQCWMKAQPGDGGRCDILAWERTGSGADGAAIWARHLKCFSVRLVSYNIWIESDFLGHSTISVLIRAQRGLKSPIHDDAELAA